MKHRIESLCLNILLAVFLVAAGAPVKATEEITLSVLTLDDRPPNNLFLKQLAAVAGINLHVSFNPEDASTADCVSLNTAVAGSLVGSRTADPWSLAPPKLKSNALIHFAFPRVEPTVLKSDVIGEYNRIRNSLANPDFQRKVLSAIVEGTEFDDDPYIADYANRVRGWLDFLKRASCDPDRLLITLDDNRPGPLSDGLKLAMRKYSHHIYDGTDEGMMLLLARALRELQSPSPDTCPVIWTHPGDLVTVMPYESSIVAQNLIDMTLWLNLRISPRIELYESWRPVLWINGTGADDSIRAQLINDATKTLADRTVIVADISKNTAGEHGLIGTWRKCGTPSGLIGYLGWNTSSNTIGSAVALWAAIDFGYYHSADPEGVKAAIETFLWARFLDDVLYQDIVRSERRDLFVAGGGDPFRLTVEQTINEEAAIASRITELWREMGESLSLPLRFVAPLKHSGFIVELPWNRFFEIALYPTDDRHILPVIRPVEPSQ